MNNGRVNIMGRNPVDRFNLYEKTIPSKSTSYKDALVGNFQDSILSKVFFSAENIQILQNAIRAGIYKKSNNNYKIGVQDEDVLKTIMRAMFLQFSKNLDTNITKQVEDLNKHVTNYAIPQIYNEIVGYLKYKQDVSSMATPIDLPTSCYHSNTLHMKPFF